MKLTHLIALAATACSTLALAATDKPAAPKEAAKPAKAAKPKSAAAKAEARRISRFVELQDAAFACFMELGETLELVTDQERADAAAPEVQAIAEKLCGIIAEVVSMGEPSEVAQQAIMARMADKAEQDKIAEKVMLPLLDLMMMDPPCHGSEALHAELTALLENLQGAAGVDDEDVEAEAPRLTEPDAEEAGAADAAS